jgi:hypothetical protein
MAGVLLGGAGSALSHRSAADHWELTRAARPHADVIVTGRTRPRPGVTFRESKLLADETTVHAGIPVTTVARTLLDLSSIVSTARLRQAVSVAEARLLADSPSLPELIARHPSRRGMAKLRLVLKAAGLGHDVARSELELRFLEFLERRGLQRPDVNAIVEVAGRTLEVDCLWRSAGLVVELDSRSHHADSEAFETDRARDLSLLAVGFRTARVTWRKLHDDADFLEAEIRGALRLVR